MSRHTLDTHKDEPLRNDIRLLGRILGDTVREQEGDATFEIIERVRQTAIRFAREYGRKKDLQPRRAVIHYDRNCILRSLRRFGRQGKCG